MLFWLSKSASPRPSRSARAAQYQWPGFDSRPESLLPATDSMGGGFRIVRTVNPGKRPRFPLYFAQQNFSNPAATAPFSHRLPLPTKPALGTGSRRIRNSQQAGTRPVRHCRSSTHPHHCATHPAKGASSAALTSDPDLHHPRWIPNAGCQLLKSAACKTAGNDPPPACTGI